MYYIYTETECTVRRYVEFLMMNNEFVDTILKIKVGPESKISSIKSFPVENELPDMIFH